MIQSRTFRVGASFALAIIVARPSAPQSLDVELAGLLRNSPEIAARRHAVDAAQSGVDKAFAGYLPKFDVNAGYGPQYIDSPVAEAQGGGAFSTIAEVAGARVTQNVFDGYATPAAVRGARLSLETAQFTLDGAQQATLLQGVTAYVEVLRQQRLVTLSSDSERTIMRQLRLEDERVTRGAGIAVDVLQAKARLQVAKERRVAYEGGFSDATARYIQVFDHPPDLRGMSDPTPPLALLPVDETHAEEVARNRNPVVDASLATLEAARERQRLARSDYYPRLDIVGSASRENNNGLVKGTQVDMSILLQTTWNLFNGFATDASVGEASAYYQSSLRNHDLVVRNVVQATRLAWNEHRTTAERVALLENAVNIAAEVFDARSKLREAGRETVINVLDAENEVYNARINLEVARGDAKLAIYRLLQGMGRLDPASLDLPADPKK